MSIIDQVRPLAEQELPANVIAERLGLNYGSVKNAMNKLRDRGEIGSLNRAQEQRLREGHVTRAAVARGIDKTALWRRIKTVIARDNLFDAVLDDRGDA